MIYGKQLRLKHPQQQSLLLASTTLPFLFTTDHNEARRLQTPRTAKTEYARWLHTSLLLFPEWSVEIENLNTWTRRKRRVTHL